MQDKCSANGERNDQRLADLVTRVCKTTNAQTHTIIV